MKPLHLLILAAWLGPAALASSVACDVAELAQADLLDDQVAEIEEEEVELLQTSLLQTGLRRGPAVEVVAPSPSVDGVSSGSLLSVDVLIEGLEQFEANLKRVSSRLEDMSALQVEDRSRMPRSSVATDSPWFFQPVECFFSFVQKLGDFVGDLFLHPRQRAWRQLLVFIACLLGVVAAGIQVKQGRFCRGRLCGAGSEKLFGYAAGILCVFIAGAICHPAIPWLLIFVWFWTVGLLPARLEKPEVEGVDAATAS
eukprot:gb/GFBE01043019.1/.p1 GENE.gb/GFBE01043019.1/~~gb/GFBE01043019.1/.p1  ORF type:complete len:255 (+),score=54.58 gb/GFBE01043019.1/:1-765(+)